MSSHVMMTDRGQRHFVDGFRSLGKITS